MSTIDRWLRREDIFSYHYILIPINLPNHWVLCVVDFENFAIKIFNSLQTDNDHGIGEVILAFLRREHLHKKGKDLDHLLYRTEVVTDIPRQTNDFDCGVFVILYALCVSRQQTMTFDQSDIPSWRLRILAEIVNNRLVNSTDVLDKHWHEGTEYWD